MLDWLYHAKGDKNRPVDLDNYWVKELGFSKTPAVVLDLLAQDGKPGGTLLNGQKFVELGLRLCGGQGEVVYIYELDNLTDFLRVLAEKIQCGPLLGLFCRSLVEVV